MVSNSSRQAGMLALLAALLMMAPGAALFAQVAEQIADQFPGRPQVSAEIALRALQEGFPDRVGEVAFADGDWTVRVGGETFFWAGGRLLPEAYRHRQSEFGHHSFYTIPESPPSPSGFSPEQIEALRERGSPHSRAQRLDVHRGFQAALYGGSTRREIEALQRRVQFLGFRVTVHRDIAEALARVEAEIRQWPGAEDFIATLGSIAGYSWREIAGTQRMSFHSWGLAVDILPRSRARPIFWQWERDRGAEWMLIPLESRWNPPPQVVEAFKRQGFIWGGKWVFFDNMHFEFRPELLAYTRLRAAARGPGGRSLHHVYPDGLSAAP